MTILQLCKTRIQLNIYKYCGLLMPECLKLDNHIVQLLQAALHSLSAGCAPFNLTAELFPLILYLQIFLNLLRNRSRVRIIRTEVYTNLLNALWKSYQLFVNLPVFEEMATCIIDFLADKVLEKM